MVPRKTYHKPCGWSPAITNLREPLGYVPRLVGAKEVPADQLVGASEIAERLGARHASLVHDWIARYDDFPQPVARLRAGLVWDWRDVEAWARETGRLPPD